MKLKTVVVGEKTYAEVLDGKPVFIADDGKEVAIDVPHTTTTITRLNSEAKGHRERAETAETKLKAFEGIEDVAAAIKALETVKNLDEGKLLTAGKVEEIKAAAKRAAEEQVAAANKANAEKLSEAERRSQTLSAQLDNQIIGGFFKEPAVIEPFAIPSDMIEARFRQNCKIEDGKLVVYDNTGNKVFSRSKPGEVAEPKEALGILIEQYPYKDQILKGANHSGSGARPGAGGGNGAKKTITREAFSKLDPVAQRAAAIGKDAMQIID